MSVALAYAREGLDRAMTSRTPPMVLPISAFNDARMFESAPASSGATAARAFELQLWGMSFVCHYEADIQTLVVISGTVRHTITVDQVSGRRYFLCGCCAQRREAVILENDELLCREVYRNEGRNHSKAIRSALFALTIKHLRSERPVAKVRRPEPRGKASSYEPSDNPVIEWWAAAESRMSTSKAIALGRGAGQHPLYEAYCRADREHWQTIETAPLYQRPATSSLTDEHPRLALSGQMHRLVTN